jgi:hypothetical protein
LQENITLTMYFLKIIMVMSMLNMLAPMMVTLNMIFGCLRFLWLTKEGPFKNGDLKPRINFL